MHIVELLRRAAQVADAVAVGVCKGVDKDLVPVAAVVLRHVTRQFFRFGRFLFAAGAEQQQARKEKCGKSLHMHHPFTEPAVMPLTMCFERQK